MRADLRVENVDGVQTFWFEEAGPATATLMFRVSVIDETLYLKGITHMVEHLALQPLGLQPYAYNGFVDHLRTGFTVTGETGEIVSFLRTVCGDLAGLPLDRFEHERRILLTESERHSPGGIDAMLAMRYGPRGPGLPGYPELGLHHLEAERVAAWAQTYFRPENAVLWLTTAPPAGLTLPLAPGGSRHPLPETEPLVTKLPAWTAKGERGVALSSIHPRSVAASALPGIAERRLLAKLRYEDGLAYEIGSTYFPVAAATAFSALWADTPAQHAAEARDVFLGILEALEAEGPTDEEVRWHKDAFREYYASESRAAALLDATAVVFLIDAQSEPRDLVAETDALTAADVAAAARHLSSAAVYELPEGSTMPAGHEPVADSPPDEVRGERFTSESGAETLVLADDGFTLYGARGRHVTIRFDRCEAMTAWDDGTRMLYGSDGFGATIVPARWRHGDAIVRALDDRLAQRAVRMTGGDSREAGAPAVPSARRTSCLGTAALVALLAAGASAAFHRRRPFGR